ncbi:uroporphyrin-III C-methyltransferase [Methylomarinovum caldicuralii]|uniref:Uroporphyrin-III C-methyltransferase n=1 Tax=Methylomarinovum caldicuralii TaxID=438856 RepID=A0AAU9C9V9_9GAMM|nr:uroporphyrinogen-III C-methyltransferase [Methylomarinovum caldicuralii]BCX82829.1 uroporphyrin-III C-methyltransferase [Methylomarinovum caldicuralii]
MADLVPEDEFEDEGLGKLGLWITIVVVLLILALGGGGYYLFQKLRSEQAGLGGAVGKESQRVLELTHQVTTLQKEIALIHRQLTDLDARQAAQQQRWRQMRDEQAKVFDAKLEALEKKLENSHAKLVTQIQALGRQISRTRADVMLADAEYLLSAANQKLRLTGDVQAALRAMEAADELLRQSGDPAVFKVREALVKEIAALRKVKQPDVVGVSAQLLALEEQVNQLPLYLPHMGKVTGGQKKAHPSDQDIIEQWKDVLTIRRRKTERPVEAILTPEEVEAIRHALILKLETARFAAIRGEPGLYRSSLEAAKQWVRQHFDTQTSQTKDFLAALDRLMEQPVAVQLPEIGQSLKLLRHLPQLRLDLDRLDSAAPAAPAQ